MKIPAENLLFQDSHDSLMRVLQSWRLWLVGALAGALLAAGVYALFPPPYQTAAVVVVDLNIEEAWPVWSNQQPYFISRESRKLEQLAWSDETIQLVADQVGDVSVSELRGGILKLSQPADGGWQFNAQADTPERAEQIAAAWADAFTQQVAAGIELSGQWEQERQEIVSILQGDPNMSANDASKLVDRLAPTIAESKGISPYIELFMAQTEDLAVERTVALSVYILVGSVIGALGFAFIALFFLRGKRDDVRLVE